MSLLVGFKSLISPLTISINSKFDSLDLHMLIKLIDLLMADMNPFSVASVIRLSMNLSSVMAVGNCTVKDALLINLKKVSMLA